MVVYIYQIFFSLIFSFLLNFHKMETESLVNLGLEEVDQWESPLATSLLIHKGQIGQHETFSHF